MKKLFLIRHGRTDWNDEGRIQGHIDIPLNTAGQEQARALIRPLRRLGVQAFLSSDLSRARETAEIIGSALGVPVSADPGLREIYLGKIQGLTSQEIIDQFGAEFSDRMRHAPLGDQDVTFLGSESGEEVRVRAMKAILSFAQNTSAERIGVVSHGGVVRRLVQHGLSSREFPPPIKNCVVYTVHYEPESGLWELASFSEIC